tara:strand:+ start:1140 stop:1724 length:585 start_codon:yes stop_codon:yes gene_type:complete
VTVTISDIYLKEVSSGKLVKAELHDSIQQTHLDHHDQHWKPVTTKLKEQQGHWDWQKKWTHYSTQLSFQSFAIECNGETQGMMIVNTIMRCQIPQQANKHLVYVEYLEAAPWNRRTVTNTPKYKLVGTVMIAAAIQLSLDEGNQGRIGLHSLPQADTFYRDQCGMTDLGRDASKQSLFYFEMTEAQAVQYMQGR